MEILVCVKQVPKLGNQTLHGSKDTIVRTKQNSMINPLDLTALSHAISIKRMTEGTLTVISMGPASCVNNLEFLLAMDVDRAVLLCDSAFAGADTVATAYTLSKGIMQLGSFDYIFCGEHTTDGDTGHLGPCLAQTLRIPHIANVNEFKLIDGHKLHCNRESGDTKEVLEAISPVLFTVTGDALAPFIEPTIESVTVSDSKPFLIWDQKQIHADKEKCGLSGSPTNVVKCSIKEARGVQAKTVDIADERAIKNMFDYLRKNMI